MIEGKPITEISESDILALRDNQVAENKVIDYKRDRISPSEKDKKEFLYDVSSFANASGGHLIIGIEEARGIPVAIPGLADINPDEEIGRLQEMIRDGIQPRLLGLEMGAVPLSNKTFVIVIRIPRSWNPPHQVIYQKAFRFYGRGVNGKHQLDVGELRQLFTLPEMITERVKQFRVERIAAIMADEVPAPLAPGARLVFHAVPLTAVSGSERVDLDVVANECGNFIQTMGRGGSSRHNLDGYLAYSRTRDKDDAYSQLFRNGAVEIAIALDVYDPRRTASVPSLYCEEQVIKSWGQVKQLYSRLGVTAPVVLMLSFVGIKNRTMGASPDQGFGRENVVFDRDPLMIPDTLLTTLESPTEIDLKPPFDAFWNAAGYEGSPHYDDQGIWIGRNSR